MILSITTGFLPNFYFVLEFEVNGFLNTSIYIVLHIFNLYWDEKVSNEYPEETCRL